MLRQGKKDKGGGDGIGGGWVKRGGGWVKRGGAVLEGGGHDVHDLLEYLRIAGAELPQSGLPVGRRQPREGQLRISKCANGKHEKPSERFPLLSLADSTFVFWFCDSLRSLDDLIGQLESMCSTSFITFMEFRVF